VHVRLSAAEPTFGGMRDQEARAALRVDFEFRMGSQKSLNRRQWSRTEGGEDAKRVDNAVLHQKKAARSNEAMVDFQFASDVCLAVVTVQEHHNWAERLGHRTGHLIQDLLPNRASDEVCDTRVRQLMHLLDVDGNDPSVADEVEDGGEKVGRSPTIRPAFDQKGRTKLTECLLDCPQVEDVLPDRLPQPRLLAKIICFFDQAREELLIEALSYADDQRPENSSDHRSVPATAITQDVRLYTPPRPRWSTTLCKVAHEGDARVVMPFFRVNEEIPI
jgi:hypothetical protein